MAPHSRGGQKTQKKKPPNATKGWTPKKLLVCCYIGIIIQKTIVEF
jgi:hypothetical protein